MVARRPVRVANCSGAKIDPGIHMLNQARYGDVDVITGDYLAEMNLAQNAEAQKKGQHPGWEATAWDGLQMSLDVVNEKRIRVVINGGALNPRGLAEKTLELVKEKNLNLSVAYVSGDDLKDYVLEMLTAGKGPFQHLDSETRPAPQDHKRFLDDPDGTISTAHAYLGARAIGRGLEKGADIIICGRVSDASPVIGAAQWWHGWRDDAWDELAGALIAGHLIECSTYSTGANFSGFDKYPTEDLVDLGCPIAEINSMGQCVITKAENLKGIVTVDVVTCQLLYELQGNIYLNSDVKADISDIRVEQERDNRVFVHGVKGSPPPPTTKLAIFYRAGFQAEMTIYATGYGTDKKFDVQEAQTRYRLKQLGLLDKFDVLEFQRLGARETNPRSQLASTTGLRWFAQAADPGTVASVTVAGGYFGMQHASGVHSSLDVRTAFPIPYLAFYPALVEQSSITEQIHILNPTPSSEQVGHPPAYEDVAPRLTYDAPEQLYPTSLGPATRRRLGDIAQARSGDKGANINFGLFVHTGDEWTWLRATMSIGKMRELMGDDWHDDYVIERVEFVHIKAVHFVIYGPLGRGVSSSSRLDSLGKGFADYIRDKWLQVPDRFFERRAENKM